MQLFRTMDIAASGLEAQRIRMDIIAENLANMHSTRTSTGGPYRRKQAVFAAQVWPSGRIRPPFLVGRGSLPGGGVAVLTVVEDQSPPQLIYDPTHPDADPDGTVRMPNVNPLVELVDMISATRSYQAGAAMLKAARGLAQAALDISR